MQSQEYPYLTAGYVSATLHIHYQVILYLSYVNMSYSSVRSPTHSHIELEAKLYIAQVQLTQSSFFTIIPPYEIYAF